MKQPKARFKIVEYINPRSGTLSWRVCGTKRNGERIRENYADSDEASLRYTELESEFHAADGVAALRATRLTDDQVAIAEAAFKRLDRPEDLITAVDHWLRTGKPLAVKESPRLDEAFETYIAWIDSTQELRPATKAGLRTRVRRFVGSVQNMRVTDVLPDHIEKFLASREVSADTKNADCKAISSFFTWCMKGKRHWAVNNPCYAVEIDGGNEDDKDPHVLPLEDCERLLRAAEAFENGRLVPYLAICLFGGLRPTETSRTNWDQVNLTDGEIRLRAKRTHF